MARVQERYGVDLMQLVTGNLVETLKDNGPLLMSIVGLLACPDLTEDEAAYALASDEVIDSSVQAFIEAFKAYMTDPVRHLMELTVQQGDA